jgi:type I restriction enzyme M protein
MRSALSIMSTVTTDIVAKLWTLCNVLKDDGVTYHQYVTELTYLLFLKMAKETGDEEQIPPATAGTTWKLSRRPTGWTLTSSC